MQVAFLVLVIYSMGEFSWEGSYFLFTIMVGVGITNGSVTRRNRGPQVGNRPPQIRTITQKSKAAHQTRYSPVSGRFWIQIGVRVKVTEVGLGLRPCLDPAIRRR